jgi:hypothetical protein
MDHQVSLTFMGKTDNPTFAIEPPKLTDEDKKKLAEAYRAAQDAK